MKIVYFHNEPNWAVHNVGKMWSSLGSFEEDAFLFADYHDHSSAASFPQADYYWFCLYIYEKYRYDPAKSIVSLHDPLELFGQVENWRDLEIPSERLSILREIRCLSVLSSELQQILARYQISSVLTPTSPSVPMRRCISKPENPSYLSVSNIYPRKNIPLLREVALGLEREGIGGTLKLGNSVLPKDSYVNLLDSHQIYLCTSYQEGGPLPAMEAMARGQVVLTTPVGQMLDLIEEGVNGYFCTSEDEFIARALYLRKYPSVLQKMRVAAQATIASKRSRKALDSYMSVLRDAL